MKKALWTVIFLWLLASAAQAGAAMYQPKWWDDSYDETAVNTIGGESMPADGDFVNSPFTQLSPGVETVSVTFFTEGAGYHNALGWFSYDSDFNIQSTGTIFDDASTSPDLLGNTDGPLQPGDTLDIVFDDPLTDAFGFWISPAENNYTYYSLNSLNLDGEDHLGAMTLNGVPGYVIGFEDLDGLGDADYNDVIISYESNLDPAPAPEPSTMILLGLGLLGLLGVGRKRFRKG